MYLRRSKESLLERLRYQKRKAPKKSKKTNDKGTNAQLWRLNRNHRLKNPRRSGYRTDEEAFYDEMKTPSYLMRVSDFVESDAHNAGISSLIYNEVFIIIQSRKALVRHITT